MAGALLSGAGTASATSAPPGYAGPFTGDCKGIHLSPDTPVGDGKATIAVWYDSSGSGTFCAKTYDNRDGSRYMSVKLQRADWETVWYDNGYYSTYAGGIYVSGANSVCATVTGQVQVDGITYGNDRFVCHP